MLKPILKTAGTLAVLLGIALTLRGTSTWLIGSMVTVNGTTNSPSAVAGYVSIPPGSYDIQDGGMAATQALVINVQISVDNTNFLTVATWTPPTTNATSWKFNPSYATQPIYLRSQIVTTGAIPVGVLFNNPNL